MKLRIEAAPPKVEKPKLRRILPKKRIEPTILGPEQETPEVPKLKPPKLPTTQKLPIPTPPEKRVQVIDKTAPPEQAEPKPPEPPVLTNEEPPKPKKERKPKKPTVKLQPEAPKEVEKEIPKETPKEVEKGEAPKIEDVPEGKKVDLTMPEIEIDTSTPAQAALSMSLVVDSLLSNASTALDTIQKMSETQFRSKPSETREQVEKLLDALFSQVKQLREVTDAFGSQIQAV